MVYESGTDIDINSWEAIAIAILVPIVAFIYGYQEWLKNNPLLKPLFTSILALIPYSLAIINNLRYYISRYLRDSFKPQYTVDAHSTFFNIPLVILPIVLYAVFCSFSYANKTKKRIKPILLTCVVLAVYITIIVLAYNSNFEKLEWIIFKNNLLWYLVDWVVFCWIPILATLWWILLRRRKFKKVAIAAMNQQSNPQQ